MKTRTSAIILMVATSAALASCATLPGAAPTANQIADGMSSADVDVIDITPATPSGYAQSQRELPRWTIGDAPDLLVGVDVGDVLHVTIFEVGYSLFAGQEQDNGVARGSTSEELPPFRIPEDGVIHVPFAGTIVARGKTTREISVAIEEGLSGQSQNAQVLVSVEDGPNRSVVLSGEVEEPGRVPLTGARERLLDAIALASGPSSRAADTLVKLTRGVETSIARLDTIASTSPENVLLAPGDRIELETHVRSITMLGAAETVSEIKFDDFDLTLSEALARGGGLIEEQSDPTGIFIFRQELRSSDESTTVRPVIYRLNLLEPASYFAAQSFQMRENDVVLVANARSNHFQKFLQMVNALAAPVVTVDLLTRP